MYFVRTPYVFLCMRTISRKHYFFVFNGLAALAFFFMIADVEAATTTSAPSPKLTLPKNFEISGWVPYWRKATGTIEAIGHLGVFKEINPFGYTVKEDGSLFDAAKIAEDPWPALVASAKAKKVRVIPTVMWSNGEAIDRILRDPKLRKAHINGIVKMVKENNFDGVDIDYEGKRAETKKYFTLFLKELYAAMGKKWVMCSIEARTPLESRFDTIPKDIEYANDYAAINKYCDRVRIMAYDQGSIDLRLNEAAPGPYVPIADKEWVEKVVKLASKSIAKNKIVIGVATYGYEYEVSEMTTGYRYKLQWAFNPKYAVDLAKELHFVPQRNSAGELSFMYSPTSTVPSVSDTNGFGALTTSNEGVATTSTFNSSGSTTTAVITTAHILWWSDAQAIKDKILLAKKLGVRGVAIFKIDGGVDPALWGLFGQ